MSGPGVAAPSSTGGAPHATVGAAPRMAAGAALRRRTAYVSPFTNSTNRYIDLHKQLLADCGYDLQPLNLRTLFSARAWGLLRPDNLITLHWLETRPFRHQGTLQALHLRGLLEFACYLLVLLLARAQRVYFVHDHAVHDTVGWQRRVSVALVGLLRWVADRRVVHDPACADRYRAEYLPHPLYWDAPGSQTAAPSVPPLPAAAHAAAPAGLPRFGLLGAVRPYKRIDALLQVWPAGLPLKIRGRSTEAYAAQLRAVIDQRGLAPAVSFVPGQLDDSAFDREMMALDVLILPHADASMLVSGAFFEAAGRVPMILARDSSFVRWAEQRLPGVRRFASDDDLADAVRALAAEPRPAPADGGARQAAVALFGWAECQRRYRAVLGPRGLAEVPA